MLTLDQLPPIEQDAISNKYDKHVKDCVRAGINPIDPHTFIRNELDHAAKLATKLEQYVDIPLSKEREAEVRLEFRNIMCLNDMADYYSRVQWHRERL
jgi:hypothetical protein